MKLINYYAAGALLPGLIGAIVMLIISSQINSDYKSEWLTKESAIGMDLMISFIFSIGYAIAGLTLFLNKFENVRNKPLTSFLAWNLLPFIWVGITVYMFARSGALQEIEVKIYVSALTIPYAICFVSSYLVFRKKNAT
ncbi:hypothetical protein K6119_11220 [Paracrocinitomix mangrovi]|uniref:hypothetical protein n=1 Tax=Paracrocinitomix mangrovi TaxID=2862509 RepID=UPI001C8E328F|nr:hypothetical protein [Paracrocinitomix mangrovi]UKN00304.1 hypothetical protein K6119_11220 [Paracrocinitomix mangrovi]